MSKIYKRETPRGWIVSSRKMPVRLFTSDDRLRNAVTHMSQMTRGWWLIGRADAEWFASLEDIGKKYPDISQYATPGHAINIYLPNHVYQWVRRNANSEGSVSSFITKQLERAMEASNVTSKPESVS